MENIIINGEQTPVKYGFNALRIFCNASGLELNDLSKLAESMTLDHAINLVWAGLKDGARVAKVDFDLTAADVADLIDENPSLINDCVALFMKSFVVPSKGDEVKK